jgi:hypothetical protein
MEGVFYLKFGCLDFNVPEHLEPLMLRDERLLHSLLKAPSFSAFSEIPVVYTLWPEGLRILLQSGKLSTGHALTFACSENPLESAALLESARSFYIETHYIWAASWVWNIQAKKLIVDAFVEDRRELQSLAEHHLSSEELASLHLKSHGLLDFQAHRAYVLLQASGLALPKWETQNRGRLVYASIMDDCQMADLLWHGGFKDVDDSNSEGCTSLMYCQTLEFADWLISHGADVHAECGAYQHYTLWQQIRLFSLANLLTSTNKLSAPSTSFSRTKARTNVIAPVLRVAVLLSLVYCVKPQATNPVGSPIRCATYRI